MIPTRIIKEPVMRMIETCRGGRKTMFCTCNNGREYSVEDLARLIGIGSSGLYQRIRRYGWEHERILTAQLKPGMRLDQGLYQRNSMDSGSDEWRRMSTKPRNRNLARICLPGTFERSMEQL